MKEIIFLDFDGVLNNSHFLQRPGVDQLSQFDPRSIKALNMLLEWVPDAVIVVSSTWRMGRSTEDLEKLLVDNGVLCEGRVLGQTPVGGQLPSGLWQGDTRGAEIRNWIEEQSFDTKADRFVILDDDRDMEPYMDKLVQTNFDSGLTIAHAEKAEMVLVGKKDG